MMPQNTMGKKMALSTNSPPSDDRMARRPKARPSERTFIRLITQALTVEPQRKATREAAVVLGTMENRELKLSARGLLPSSSGAGSQQTSWAITATKALRPKASQITSRDLR